MSGKTCVKCSIDPASEGKAYMGADGFSAFEQGLEFPLEQPAGRLLRQAPAPSFVCSWAPLRSVVCPWAPHLDTRGYD